ncbi:MAG TPA: hypothetical protein VMQ54_14350 [Steroidobacteraceae bacterium]|nr:hypothetical protein [Steroidobacteraceae bacterium]
MTKYYTDEGIEKLRDAYADLRGRRMRLQQRCMEFSFGNDRAKEYAVHGFSRRLSGLVRCIENTFSAIPPELESVPASDATHDAEIQVQAFIINVFGCLDNLAWMWVLERNITKPNGAPVPPEWVGLRAANTLVRASLGEELRRYLEGTAEWLEYLEDYRHALAHRIPLYVPPFAIDPKNEGRYRELEEAITRLVIQGHLEEAEALKTERDGLKFFRPFIAHSWSQARPMQFHIQMLADFKTIEAISAKLLDELRDLASARNAD